MATCPIIAAEPCNADPQIVLEDAIPPAMHRHGRFAWSPCLIFELCITADEGYQASQPWILRWLGMSMSGLGRYAHVY